MSLATYSILLLYSTYTFLHIPIYLPYFTPSFFHVPSLLLLLELEGLQVSMLLVLVPAPRAPSRSQAWSDGRRVQVGLASAAAAHAAPSATRMEPSMLQCLFRPTA